ncbi:MAG: DUF6036 family nucleotidyltransferase [Planctomycetota bacterium]
MEVIRDFVDLLELFEKHDVRYLIIGGLAFIYHAKPRATKDMDIFVDPSPDNIGRANEALTEFGSPWLIEPGDREQIVQIGVAPDRVDLLLKLDGIPDFDSAWAERVRDRYGSTEVNWLSLDDLIRSKEAIDHPRHREDVRTLRKLKERRSRE